MLSHLQNQLMQSVGENAGKWKSLGAVGGDVKWFSVVGNSVAGPQNIKPRMTT